MKKTYQCPRVRSIEILTANHLLISSGDPIFGSIGGEIDPIPAGIRGRSRSSFDDELLEEDDEEEFYEY